MSDDVGSVAWLATRMADHIEFMVSSGQFRGTVEQYASFPRYRSEQDREATLAELRRRGSITTQLTNGGGSEMSPNVALETQSTPGERTAT